MNKCTLLSSKALLDRLIKSQPVVMVEENSKTFWVNSVALERAGIDETTSSEDIHGGIIMKNQFGDPNGEFMHVRLSTHDRITVAIHTRRSPV